jgi:hypothetical protein
MSDTRQFKSVTHIAAVLAWVVVTALLIVEVISVLGELVEVLLLVVLLSLWVVAETSEHTETN